MVQYIYVNTSLSENIAEDNTLNTLRITTPNIKVGEMSNNLFLSVVSLCVNSILEYGNVILKYDNGAFNCDSVNNSAPCLSVCTRSAFNSDNTRFNYFSCGEQPILNIDKNIKNMTFYFEDMTGERIPMNEITYAFVLKIE
jgi:hypothetical protein